MAMKTKYWILILALLLVVCGAVSMLLLRSGEAASAVEVWSDGVLLTTMPLTVPDSLTVGTPNGYNVVTVKNGKVAVTEATCPDHYCMKRGFCDSGVQIVCLPNRLVLKFIGEQTVDAVVG